MRRQATINDPLNFIQYCNRYGRNTIIDANDVCMSEEAKKLNTNCKGCRYFRRPT